MTVTYADLHDQETQTADPQTGGRKGVKLTQIGALDPVALMTLGRVAGMGANKYAAFNYLAGFDYSKAYNAMMRHANLFWAGEDCDPESGLPHIAHAAWMAMALLSFHLRGIGNDDRPPRLDEEMLPFDDRAFLQANLDRIEELLKMPPTELKVHVCHEHPLGGERVLYDCGRWCDDTRLGIECRGDCKPVRQSTEQPVVQTAETRHEDLLWGTALSRSAEDDGRYTEVPL